MSGTNISDFHNPKGYVKSASFNTAAGLPSMPTATTAALIIVEGQTMRWRDDGTAPTATDGMLMNVGIEYMFVGNLQRLQFIETTATSTMHVSYYKG